MGKVGHSTWKKIRSLRPWERRIFSAIRTILHVCGLREITAKKVTRDFCVFPHF